MLSALTITLALAAPGADNDRPWSFQAGLGPEIGLPAGGVRGRMPLDFQYHLKRTDDGPALGFQLPMHFARSTFGMNIGPMFMWDFRVVANDKFRLYVAPMVALGYHFTTIPPLHATLNAFFMDFGGQLKGIVNERVGFFVRPLGFSLLAARGGAAGAYSFLAGVSVMF